MKSGVWAAALSAMFATCTPAPAIAADRLSPLQVAAACAPLPAEALEGDLIEIVGVQDAVPRMTFAAGELAIIGGGTADGLALDQRFYARRAPQRGLRHTDGPRGASTSGWLRIVAVNETTAIGLVEFACDALMRGDLLQPYVDPVLPPDADRTDTSGEPDFDARGAVLFGDGERQAVGIGEFVVTDIGAERGAMPGSRFAIYRDVAVDGMPIASIGEAIVMSVVPKYSVVRVTSARDAIFAGDILVPRRRP